MKALELEPYSIEDSERAAGFGSFQLPKRRKIVTQGTEDDDQSMISAESEQK
jgi:bud site selection protein 20